MAPAAVFYFCRSQPQAMQRGRIAPVRTVWSPFQRYRREHFQCHRNGHRRMGPPGWQTGTITLSAARPNFSRRRFYFCRSQLPAMQRNRIAPQATTPVINSVSVCLNHALLMTPTVVATPSTGSASPVRTINATGGTGTITYATATAGFTVNSATGVVCSTNGTAAGTFSVTVTANRRKGRFRCNRCGNRNYHLLGDCHPLKADAAQITSVPKALLSAFQSQSVFGSAAYRLTLLSSPPPADGATGVEAEAIILSAARPYGPCRRFHFCRSQLPATQQSRSAPQLTSAPRGCLAPSQSQSWVGERGFSATKRTMRLRENSMPQSGAANKFS